MCFPLFIARELGLVQCKSVIVSCAVSSVAESCLEEEFPCTPFVSTAAVWVEARPRLSDREFVPLR